MWVSVYLKKRSKKKTVYISVISAQFISGTKFPLRRLFAWYQYFWILTWVCSTKKNIFFSFVSLPAINTISSSTKPKQLSFFFLAHFVLSMYYRWHGLGEGKNACSIFLRLSRTNRKNEINDQQKKTHILIEFIKINWMYQLMYMVNAMYGFCFHFVQFSFIFYFFFLIFAPLFLISFCVI